MERTRYTPKLIDGLKKADAILTSDWHLREDTPACFTGDFQKEQWDAVLFIKALQEVHNCAILHAGDLFHHWKPSPWLLSKAMYYLPQSFHTIYGQHDLPQHNWELRDKSGVYTLERAKKVFVLEGCHYGQIPTDNPLISAWKEPGDTYYVFHNKKKILVWHHMTYTKAPFPGAKGGMAAGLLRKYPFDLIVTGDNHQSFSMEYNGRLLVNPGNITRQSAKQIDFQPRVALWYADTNTISWVNLPMQKDVITKEHIEEKQARDSRIEAFISHLNDDWEAQLSFEENLEKFKQTNQVSNLVMEIIYKAIDYGPN